MRSQKVRRALDQNGKPTRPKAFRPKECLSPPCMALSSMSPGITIKPTGFKKTGTRALAIQKEPSTLPQERPEHELKALRWPLETVWRNPPASASNQPRKVILRVIGDGLWGQPSCYSWVASGQVVLEGDFHDSERHGLLGRDPGQVLDHLVLLPHPNRVLGSQQVQLLPPSLKGAVGDIHVLANLGVRPAFILLLDSQNPCLVWVVLVCHIGGFLVYLVLS